MSIGQKIKMKRRELGFGQKEFAKKMGVPISTFSYWERDLGEPTAFSLIVIGDALGVSVDWLLDRTDKQEVNK